MIQSQHLYRNSITLLRLAWGMRDWLVRTSQVLVLRIVPELLTTIRYDSVVPIKTAFLVRITNDIELGPTFPRPLAIHWRQLIIGVVDQREGRKARESSFWQPIWIFLVCEQVAARGSLTIAGDLPAVIRDLSDRAGAASLHSWLGGSAGVLRPCACARRTLTLSIGRIWETTCIVFLDRSVGG